MRERGYRPVLTADLPMVNSKRLVRSGEPSVFVPGAFGPTPCSVGKGGTRSAIPPEFPSKSDTDAGRSFSGSCRGEMDRGFSPGDERIGGCAPLSRPVVGEGAEPGESREGGIELSTVGISYTRAATTRARDRRRFAPYPRVWPCCRAWSAVGRFYMRQTAPSANSSMMFICQPLARELP